ncbi:DNA gyrase subunit A [Clostridium perfringens]|nr:DNA gyrase subunit A [Clostridium perfringens]
MLINNQGVAIRINVSDISVTSRSAMGVKLMRTLEDEAVVTIAKISGDTNEEEEEMTLLDEPEDTNIIVEEVATEVKDEEN